MNSNPNMIQKYIKFKLAKILLFAFEIDSKRQEYELFQENATFNKW